MSESMPVVRTFMTASPHTIEADRTIADAHTILFERKVRQLPVMRSGQLVGMLSDRDLALIASLPGVEPSQLKVEDTMSVSVYKVSPDAPLDKVAAEMAARKYGAAVVVDHHAVVGIFTTVDAFHALAGVLKHAYAP